jgi:hypothetical protein
MAITKSNKQELSLDYEKPNEKGGCTLATPYALMRSLILDSQITISSLGSCTSLHMKGVSQLNKWARDLKWMSRGCIYNPSFNFNHYVPTQHFSYWPNAPVDVTGRVQSMATVDFSFKHAEWPNVQTNPIRGDRTRPVARNLLWKLSVPSSGLTRRTEATFDQ